MDLTLETKSEEETFRLAEKLGEILQPGDFITLSGDLGVGKTAFAKGVAAGLDIKEPVTSPTFTIVQEYQGRLPLFHFDTYRLTDYWDLEDIGYEEYFYSEGVCLVEWPEKITQLLPGDYLQINIDRIWGQDENLRKIRLLPKGERHMQVLEELNKLVDFRD